MPILAPFEAFARDAEALRVEEDETRLPVKWLAAAQVAARIADSRPDERKALLRVWVKQQSDDGADGVWSALAVPGIPVHDLASASEALCHIAADMERGGAFNLAYSTVTHMRLSMLDRGPARARGYATLQQARVLRQMALLEEAQDTYEEAREDAIRAHDRELEGLALAGLSVVIGHRGNYPEVVRLNTLALQTFPEGSRSCYMAHGNLMIAAKAMNDFPSAFEHGWRGYDSAGDDMERRATIIANLSALAFRLGRFKASRRGCLASLSLTTVARIQIPVLANLALIAGATNDLAELGRITSMIDRRLASTTLHFELAHACFDLAQAWQQVGELQKAEQHLSRAREIAAERGFHEVSFRSEVLAEAIASAAAAAHAPRDVRLEAAIVRFDSVEADASVLSHA
ncbi:MAG TPA: hypothetical protein VE967_03740 [Gemmatimonadaceae bacterium]|nr:hypothetical protein [Gemmatimonadaceae bacterium]